MMQVQMLNTRFRSRIRQLARSRLGRPPLMALLAVVAIVGNGAIVGDGAIVGNGAMGRWAASAPHLLLFQVSRHAIPNNEISYEP